MGDAAARFRASQRAKAKKGGEPAKPTGRPRKTRAERKAEKERKERERELVERKARLERLRLEQREALLTQLPSKLPDDPFEVVEEMQKVVAYSMRMVILDDSLSGKEQRAEIRATMKAYTAGIPDSRRLAAERAVREAKEQIGRTAAPPKLAPAPADSAPLQLDPRPT